MSESKHLQRVVAAAVTSLITSIAFAQQAPVGQVAGANQSATTDDQAEAASAKALESVTVTANRRKQTLEATPLAVSVVSGTELIQKGISTPQDLVNAMPNVANGAAGFAIRGISSGDNSE